MLNLNFKFKNYNKSIVKWGGEQIAVIDFGKKAHELADSVIGSKEDGKTGCVQEVIELLKESREQYKILESTATLVFLQNKKLEDSNKLLNDQNNALKQTKETSVKILTESNTKLNNNLQEKSKYLEEALQKNISLNSQIFYYKCKLITLSIGIIIYIIYASVLNKK